VVPLNEVIEVSYTGDLLAHRRCPRAWAYEKHVGFSPYEQVQAMEGRLLHHAMEWLCRRYEAESELAPRGVLAEQLEHYYAVLRARGITTAFTSREKVLKRILENLYMADSEDAALKKPVAAVVRGAQHTEYQLRSVKKVVAAQFAGKSKILLTGIIDLVLQQTDPLTYGRAWVWDDEEKLEGHLEEAEVKAQSGEEEIWDFKATRAKTKYLIDYIRQVATYAALYRERTGQLPVRCVLFFVNEPKEADQLVAVPVSESLVEHAVQWTEDQVEDLRSTTVEFAKDPASIVGGSLLLREEPVGERITEDLRAQCTACGQRFDCEEYATFLGSSAENPKREVDTHSVERS
jgi:DNA helicase II / ATP-dependent DNA helicase PcrA